MPQKKMRDESLSVAGGLRRYWQLGIDTLYPQPPPTPLPPFSSNPFAGNGFYNDHELQYGYVVHNLAWVLNEYHAGVDLGINASRAANITELALLFAREYANPVEEDYYFTRLRQKDVFDGHSWQEGVRLARLARLARLFYLR